MSEQGTEPSDFVKGFAGAIVQALREPVLIVDLDLRAILANPAFLSTLEVPPDAVVGRSVDELLSRPGGPEFGCMLTHVQEAPGAFHEWECTCTLPSGKQVNLEAIARRIHGADDQPDVILVELRDVTAASSNKQRIRSLRGVAARRAAALEAANKELEAFSYSVAHDLRTPLRFMNKMAHLLLREHAEKLPYSALQHVEMILETTRQMGELLEDLLSFSRIVGQPLERQTVDVAAVVDQVLAELQDMQTDRTVTVTKGDLPACTGDPVLLARVFENLLANALKFTRPRKEARIEIGAITDKGEQGYYVKDNGVGFDMADADMLFVVFRRLHQPEEFEGTGVGLALVKRIVERHGGRVWAESTPGHGATFYFTVGSDDAPAP